MPAPLPGGAGLDDKTAIRDAIVAHELLESAAKALRNPWFLTNPRVHRDL
jgi:hypothetical protein